MKIKKEILHNKNNRKEKINSFLNNLVWFLGIVFVLHEIIAPPIYKNNLFFIECVSTDELTHQRCGRNFEINVCLVDKVQHLYH